MEQEQNAPTSENLNNIPVPSATAGRRTELSSVSSLVEKAFEIYRVSLWKFIGMMFVPLLGLLPIIAILSSYGALKFFIRGESVMINIVSIFLGLLGLVALVVAIYVGVVAQAGLLILVGGGATEISVKDAFLNARKYAWKLVIINFSVALFTILWGLLFIIPGVIMAVAYTYAQWAFFYEGFTGTAALKRSKELVKGDWWNIFMRSVGLYIILYAVLWIPSIILGDGIFEEIWSIISQIISFVAAPFFMIVSSLVFQELRGIKGESKIAK